MTKLPDNVVHAAVEGYFGYKMPPSEERNQTMRRALDAANLNIVAYAERLEENIANLRAENEKLLADAERLSMMLKEQDFELERLRQSYIPFAEKHNELRDAVKQLFKDRTFATFEQNLSWLKRYIDQYT